MEQDNNFIKNKPLIFQTNEEITLPPEQWQQQEEKDADGNFVCKCIVDGDLKDAVLTALPMQNDKHKPDFSKAKILFSGKFNEDNFEGAVLPGTINKGHIKMYGVYKAKSGASYEGFIDEGKKSGKGTYTRKDKNGNMVEFTGMYENDNVKKTLSIKFTELTEFNHKKETILTYPENDMCLDSINFEQRLVNGYNGAEINNLTEKGTISFADNNRMELLKYFGDTICEGFAKDFNVQFLNFEKIQELNNKLAGIKQTLEQNKTENFEAIFAIPGHEFFVESERNKNGEIIFNAFDINQEKGQDILFKNFKEKNTDINKYPEIQKLNYVNDFKFDKRIKLNTKTTEGKDFMLEFYAPQVCRHLTAIFPTVHEKNKETTEVYLGRTNGTIRAMSPSRKSL